MEEEAIPRGRERINGRRVEAIVQEKPKTQLGKIGNPIKATKKEKERRKDIIVMRTT